jgi:hypothetical protein
LAVILPADFLEINDERSVKRRRRPPTLELTIVGKRRRVDDLPASKLPHA